MKRHKHRPRLPRETKPPRPTGQGWTIGPMPERSEAGLVAERPPVTVDLNFPIKVAGETWTSLTLRSPTHRDLLWYRFLRGDELSRVLAMVARLCDLPRGVLDELDPVDMDGLLDACNDLVSEH